MSSNFSQTSFEIEELAMPETAEPTGTSFFDRISSYSSKNGFGLRRVFYRGGAELPEGWLELTSNETNEFFFYNSFTRKKYFKFPLSVYPPADSTDDLDEYIFPWTRLRCSHILIKHREVDNPLSWREPVITLTKTEALKRILDARNMIVKGECGFGEMALAISDCCTARRAGDMGIFRLNQTVKEFENVLLRLKMHELSNIFETHEGLHIMVRTPAVNARPRKMRHRMKRQERIASFNVKGRYKLHLATSNCKCKTQLEDNKMLEALYQIFRPPRTRTSQPTQKELQKMFAEQQRWIKQNVMVNEQEPSTDEDSSTGNEDDA